MVLSQRVQCTVMLAEQLERERTLNAALERDVVNIEERQEHQRKLNDLNEKRPWVVSSL